MPKKKRSKRHSQNKLLWVTVLLVFLVSMIAILISGHDDPTLTGNAAIETISYAAKGSQLHFEIRNIPGLKEAVIFLNEEVKDGKIFFTEDDTLKFSGTAYSKFKVSSADAAKISKIRFTLKVNNDDLQKLGLDTIHLYVDGQKKVTTFVKEENNYRFYTVDSTEMGDIVIGKEKEVLPPTMTETAPIPSPLEVPAVVEPAPAQQAISGQAIASAETESLWNNITHFFKNLFD